VSSFLRQNKESTY